MLNDVDKLSDGAKLLQRLSKSTGFGDDLTAANQLKTFNQGLKEFSQAAKASLSKEALEDLGENLRNLTFQVPSQEFALESAGTTGKIKGIGEFLDEAKLNVQRFATSSSDDVAKVGGKLDEVGNVESKVGSVADDVVIGSKKVDSILPDASIELKKLRVKWGVPETDTIAVGKTDVKGLEGITFEGGSPKVRKEAGLPDLNISNPDRPIQGSGKIASATRHAEEGVANEFVKAVKKAGLKPEKVSGILRLHQSNPKGVCPTCLSGLGNPNKTSGVIKQLSEMFPDLEIRVTSEVFDNIKPNGRLEFIVKNGKYVN